MVSRWKSEDGVGEDGRDGRPDDPAEPDEEGDAGAGKQTSAPFQGHENEFLSITAAAIEIWNNTHTAQVHVDCLQSLTIE